MSAPSAQLARLGDIAEQAGRIAQDARRELQRELKPDGSVVTNGDRTVEEFLRRELPLFVQDTTVWGEEFGHSPEGPGGVWAVDPVDGTSNYAYYSPLWGVSIGLVRDARVVMGAIALPDLGEMYLAESGGGAFLNGRALPRIPPGPVLPQELVSYCEPIARGYAPESLPGKMRCSGAFVIDGSFVACQRYRGLIGIRERLYDIAASVLLCTELGGDVRYLDGEPMDLAELMDGSPVRKPWVLFPQGSGLVLTPE